MIPVVWFLGCLAALVTYWRLWLPNVLDADMASEQILAHQLAVEGGILSPTWFYSTELRVINTQLVMAPLFRLFSNWHTVRVAGSILLVAVYLAAWFVFARAARLRGHGVVGAGLLVLPFGALYCQYVLAGLYYIPHIAFNFLMLACALYWLRGGGRFRAGTAAGFVLLSFLAALGGPRQLFILQIPLTLAALLLTWRDAARTEPTLAGKLRAFLKGPYTGLLAFCLTGDAAGVAGYAVNAKILAQHYHFQDQGYLSFANFSVERLGWLAEAFTTAFGWQTGSVFSLRIPFNLLALGLLAFSFWFSVRLVRGREIYPPAHRLVGAFYLAGAACFVFLYAFTDSGHSDRYVLPLTILFIPLLEIWRADRPAARRGDANLVLLALAAVLTLRGGLLYAEAAGTVNPNRAPAEFLVNSGYTQGYASFWDGNIMTELTDGRLEVWGLAANNDLEVRAWLQPTDHLTQTPQGKVFFVISKWEAWGERQPTLPGLAEHMPEDALIYEDAHCRIYGFASDAAMREACGFAPAGE